MQFFGSVMLPFHPLRLLLAAILRGGPDLVVSIALICSTFVSISRGSTMRDYFLPLGDETAPSVVISNLLASRTLFVETSHYCAVRNAIWRCLKLQSDIFEPNKAPHHMEIHGM